MGFHHLSAIKMADHRHPHHPSLLHSTGDVGFTSLSHSRRSYSSPPEFFRLLPAFSFASSKDDGNGNGLFSGGKLLLPLSFLRNAQWLDYRRLHGHRDSNHHSRGAADCGCCTGIGIGVSLESRALPKWYRVLTVGVARVSHKIELEDMRKRQVRQCPGEEREEGLRKITTAGWKVMSVLSCKGFTSVAVSPSIACFPPQPHHS